MMSPEVENAMMQLRAFLFENVYSAASKTNEEEKAGHVVEEMFSYFVKYPDKLPDEYLAFLDTYDTERVVCDYIAGMSDEYAISTYTHLFIPRGWTVF